MKNKIIKIVVLALILALLGGWYFWHAGSSVIDPSKASKISPTEGKSQSIKTTIPVSDKFDQKSNQPNADKHGVTNAPAYFYSNGAPFETRLARLAKERPELALTDAEIVDLQVAYSEQCVALARMEVGLATITDMPNGSRLVEIPSYKEKGESLAKALEAYILNRFGENPRAKDIAAVILPAFSGDNNQLGEQPRKLLVSATNPSGNDFQIVKEIITKDIAGNIVSSAAGVDTVSVNTLGIYANQKEFFPTLNNTKK